MTTRDMTPVDSLLSQTFREAMRLCDKMKADGVSRDDRDAFLATSLKAAWPKGREEPWHYQCDLCLDTGWRSKTCVNRSCGRPFKLPNQASDDYTGQGRCADGHAYVEPCWCPRGVSQRRGLMKQQRAPEDALALAARTTKPTKVGR